MQSPLSLRVSNVVGYVGLIAINVAASRGWLGPTNEKLSKKNHTPITPAGWVSRVNTVSTSGSRSNSHSQLRVFAGGRSVYGGGLLCHN